MEELVGVGGRVLRTYGGTGVRRYEITFTTHSFRLTAILAPTYLRAHAPSIVKRLLPHIDIVDHEHERAIAVVVADIADGELHLLAGIGREVVAAAAPTRVVGRLVVALVQTDEVLLCGVVRLRGDVDHEALRPSVGRLRHEGKLIVGAHGDDGRDEPVVVGIARAGAREAHILLSAVGSEDGIVVPPGGDDGQGIDDLSILHDAAVGIAAHQGGCRLKVGIDAGPLAELYGPSVVALEVVEEGGSLLVPREVDIVLARHGIVHDDGRQGVGCARLFGQGDADGLLRLFFTDVEVVGERFEARAFDTEVVVACIHLDGADAFAVQLQCAVACLEVGVCQRDGLSVEVVTFY